jgi:trigger factor
VNIEVKDTTAVDKDIILTAPLSEINEQIEKKIKKYAKQVNMPGFRAGKAPLAMVRKRLQDDVEQEEAAAFIQKTFEGEIAEAHKPVGESQLTSFEIIDGQIKASFRIGVRPEFTIGDLSTIEVDKMVHDVTDEEVETEFNKSLERAAEWNATAEPVATGMKATVDLVVLTAEGEVNEEETERAQEFDFTATADQDDALKPFKDAILGKNSGDVVDLTADDIAYRIDIKEVQAQKVVEANEEFFKEQTNDTADTEDAYRSWLKSRMQEYYDQQATQNYNSSIVEAIIEQHELEVPGALLDSLAKNYLENLSQQMGGKIPEGFGIEQVKSSSSKQLLRDARWFFISEKLEELHAEQLEIKPEDIDGFLAEEAAKYNMEADQIKSYYAQNPGQLDQLRGTIREKKLFVVLAEQVKENELTKEAFNKKLDEKKKANEDAAKAAAEATTEEN